MRTILRLLIFATLALSFVLFHQDQHSTQASRVEDSRPMVATPQQRFAPLPPFAPLEQRPARLRLIPRRVREINKRLGYAVKTRYPQIAGASDARAQKFNREIAALLMKEINNFTKDFKGPKGRDVRGAGDNTLDAQYKVELATNDLVSVWFGITTYFSGAVHPSHESRVFNYDLDTGRTLRLSDIFKPNSRYLEKLSDYSINAIKENLGDDADEEMIRSGAAPTEENYRNWNVNRNGLVIMFDAYQVASYAAGPQEVTVPYDVLKDALKTAGPLTSITRDAPTSGRRGR